MEDVNDSNQDAASHNGTGIFKRRTSYATLDRLLKRLLGRKNELLRVLERPQIPLNTNASENDIRAFVTKRKISGGTISEKGRQARDTMLGLAKTCMKLKIPFFDYLGARLGIPGPNIPNLATLVSPASQLAPRPGICPGYMDDLQHHPRQACRDPRQSRMVSRIGTCLSRIVSRMKARIKATLEQTPIKLHHAALMTILDVRAGQAP